ncbi:MAG: HNH endonuclease [Candidatus Pacearchaeota archaeon]
MSSNFKGKHHSEETKELLRKKFKIIAIQKGFGKWMLGKKLEYVSESNKKRFKGKTYKEIYGDKAEEEALKRKESNRKRWEGKRKCDDRPYQNCSYEYVEWRKKVFERDNYTCQKCGLQTYIEAHHIKRWSLYPELRYDVNNGITLCKNPCHKEANKLNKE